MKAGKSGVMFQKKRERMGSKSKIHSQTLWPQDVPYSEL
jgi:hypothetical protein